MKITYHAKSGRFCAVDSAKTVTKGGEKFVVVRQHRRVKPKASPPETTEGKRVRWIPVSEVFAAFGGRRGL